MAGVAIAVAALTAGCAGPSKTEWSAATFGTLPPDYQEQIHGFLDVALKDPYSAHVDIGTPRKAAALRGLVNGGGYAYGYSVTVAVNAKNSFGGYTGTEVYTFFFAATGKMAALDSTTSSSLVFPAPRE